VLNRWHYYRSFVNHYMSATLIDVLHSPFVFSLYNQCIKKSRLQPVPEQVLNDTSYSDKRINEILLKYVLHYRPQKIYISRHAEKADLMDALHALNIHFSHELPFRNCDLMYLEHVPDCEKMKLLLPHLHNDAMIIVRNMYDSKNHTAAWAALKSMPEISVTVDMFFAGLIFIRREQRKQNFRLRLF
jgi:hypothetical protein